MTSFYAERILHHTSERQKVRVLSFGLGHGSVLHALADGFASRLDRYVALEGSGEVIRQVASQRAWPSSVELIETMFETADLHGQQFDVIEMGFVLEHVDEPAVLLDVARPLLAEGGSIFASVPNALSLHRRLGQSAGFLADPYQLNQYDFQLGHKRYFDAESFETLFSSHGYLVKRREGLLLKPLTTGQLASLNLPASVLRAFLEVGVELDAYCNGVMVEAQLS